jgi:hypothetical protein
MLMNENKNFCEHFYPERYSHPFFVDEKIQNAIKEKGFYVMDLLDKYEITKLYLGFEKIRETIKEQFGDQFWPSGRHESTEVRNLAKKEVEAIVPSKLESLFVKDSYTFIGGTYLVKPPSKNSALNPHQDSAHVNELEHFSVYSWITLQDVDDKNGAIKVLPGSHQLDIKQRSLNVPWVLEPHLKVLEEYMLSVSMKAGQVMFFDAALIHSSPPNLSDDFRVAVNFYIHNRQSPFTHYYRDENTPTGQVELYAVTPEFYYSEDFESKPSQKYPLLGNQQQFIESINEKDLRTVLNRLTGKPQSLWQRLSKKFISKS